MGSLELTDEGPIRLLTLSRPEVRNALDPALREALMTAFHKAGNDGRVRAVVLTGAGNAFCSGLDLGELERVSRHSTEFNRDDSRALAELFRMIYTFPKPVVAAVNGHAVAGGAGLASACDLVVMSESAKLGYTEVRIGFVPALVAAFLIRQLGEKRTRDLLLSGRLISADEAAAWGLVNDVVAADEVVPRALALAATLAANAPSSLALTKGLLCALPGMGLEDGLRLGIEVNALARTTDDLREGVRAFLDKRPPRWPKRKEDSDSDG